MRATDIARRYVESAPKVVDATGHSNFAKGVLALGPGEEAKLEIVAPVRAEVQAYQWPERSFVLCAMEVGELPIEDASIHGVIESVPEGTTCMVLLPRHEWYVRSLLDPMTRHGWAAHSLLQVSNRPYECALVATKGSAADQLQLRVRNEYVHMELTHELQALTISDLRAQLTRETGELSAALAKHQQDAGAELARLGARVAELQSLLTKAHRQTEVVTERWKIAEQRHNNLRESGRYKFGNAMWRIVRTGRDVARQVRSRRIPGPKPPEQTPASSRVVETYDAPRVSLPKPATPTALSELRVAAILDEMSAACFEPECELIQFTPNDWRETLEDRPPHFLLVESAWQGNGGSWQYKIGRYNHPDAGGLSELLTWCNKAGIPTVFWNKEDPVHFDKFKHAAAQFNVVFTTDADAMPRYEALPQSRISHVGALPFAAQPRLHNPIFAGERSKRPCFAGSYYGNRHPDRRAQQEMLLDAASPHDLLIYDRNHGTEAAEFQFPERLRKHIKGRLPYTELSRVYKQHRVFLNVNSVIDSPTMMSRRVYELLASGTAVVSTPSRSIEAIFGELVWVVQSREEVDSALHTLLANDASWLETSRNGVRHVMGQHSYSDRLRTIADALGLSGGQSTRTGVSIAVIASSPEDVAPLLRWLPTQMEANPAEFLVGCRGDTDAAPIREAIAAGLGRDAPHRVVALDSAEFAGQARELAAVAANPWVFLAPGKLPEDPFLLADCCHATLFTNAQVIGTTVLSDSNEPTEQAYVDRLDPAALLVAKSLLERVGWTEDAAAGASWLRALRREGVLLHSVRRLSGGAPSARRRAG